MRRVHWAVAVALGVGAISRPAAATDFHLNWSYFSAIVNYGAGSFTSAGTQFQPAGASATLTLSPSLSLSAQWTYNAAAVAFGSEEQWQAIVGYTVTVGGPAGQLVPIDVSYSITSTATALGGSTAITQAGFNYDNNLGDSSTASYDPTYRSLVANAGNVGTYSLGTVVNSGIQSFKEYSGVSFFADFAATETLYYAGSSTSVFIDPSYYIDPSFAAIDPNYLVDYPLSFSDGVQNIGPQAAAPVPEAGSLQLMTTGLIMLVGLTIFRRGRASIRR